MARWQTADEAVIAQVIFTGLCLITKSTESIDNNTEYDIEEHDGNQHIKAEIEGEDCAWGLGWGEN
jgi:hypothetical protein